MDRTSREEATRIEVTIGVPVHVVWRALRAPDQIRRWHGQDDTAYERTCEQWTAWWRRHFPDAWAPVS